MAQEIIEGLLLGLTTGAYCLGVCLVFFMPYLLAEGRRGVPENLRDILLFMLGRLAAYLGFALFVGFLGVRYKGLIPAKLSYFSLIAVSLLMLLYAVTRNFGELKFCRWVHHRFSSMRMPFLLGILLGLNPCPPFLLGAARIWTLGNVWLGVVLFFAFFLGTSVYIIPFIFVSYLNRIERLKQIGVIMVFLAGFWFLCIGILGVIK